MSTEGFWGQSSTNFSKLKFSKDFNPKKPHLDARKVHLGGLKWLKFSPHLVKELLPRHANRASTCIFLLTEC